MENRVRADFLRFLMLGGDKDAPIHEKGVQLQGAWMEIGVFRDKPLPRCYPEMSRARSAIDIAVISTTDHVMTYHMPSFLTVLSVP
jgi:hypothetical protein